MRTYDSEGRPTILYIIGQLARGGAERQLFSLLRHLRLPATVLSLSSGGYWADPIRSLGARVIELDRRGHLEPRRLYRTIRVIREVRPDIIHIFLDQVGALYGRLGALMAGRGHLIVGERSHPSRHPAWYRALLPLMNRFTSAIVCNSKAAGEYMTKRGLNAGREVLVIPNGIILDDFTDGDSPASDPWPPEWCNTPVVGMVGHLSIDKSPGTFVRACAAIRKVRPDVRFVLTGDGPLRSQVEALVRSLGMTGFLMMMGQRSDVPRLLKGMDLLISTSSIEGMPNVLIEAMAAGLPVVATDVGGCREVLIDGETGYLVGIGDVAGLAARAVTILNDTSLRLSMGRAARARAERNFDVRRTSERYRHLYQALHAGRRPSA